jgi:hypothetical protein
MARPKKKGVDYFPHDCISGKTLFIIEQDFGNDGYAFWFKLLEHLGTQEDHVLDCNNPAVMAFLRAKTKLSVDVVCSILDLLATLEAIDPFLWSKKIVWCQNFVDRVSDVYLNRRVDIPEKPIMGVVSTDHNPATIELSCQPTEESTQIKLNETKVKETTEIQFPEVPSGILDSPMKIVQERKPNITAAKHNYHTEQSEYKNTILSTLDNMTVAERKSKLAEYLQSKKPSFIEPYADLWNLSAEGNGLAGVEKISDSRIRKFKSRIKDPGFDFIKILQEIKVSGHLRGQNARGWKATFDWIFENDSNYLKIIEGNYRNAQN